MAHGVHYGLHMKPGFLRTALWVAVFVMPGGVLLLPALMLPRNGLVRGAAQPPASTSAPTNVG
jgi:hypothetical protein